MNLRGKFTTDKDGHISFRSVKPAGYPIPVDGRSVNSSAPQRRHNMRPGAPAFPDLQAGLQDPHLAGLFQRDPNLDTDVQFGVTETLIGNYVKHDSGTPPAPGVKAPWYTLDYTFTVEEGEPKLPRPPISAKAEGERAKLEILERA